MKTPQITHTHVRVCELARVASRAALVGLVSSLMCTGSLSATVLRVKESAVPPSNPDGLLWANAFPNIETAPAVAQANDEIRIAASGSMAYHPLSVLGQWAALPELKVVLMNINGTNVWGGAVFAKAGYAGFPGCVDIGAYERATAEAPSTPCWSDLDSDGEIGAADLAALLGQWSTTGCQCADLDGDGVVGASDLASLIGDWGACVFVPPGIFRGGEEAMGSESSLAVTPASLAELYGFESVTAFGLWVGSLDPAVRDSILASLGGGA